MIEYNAMIINGTSTADLPFECAVVRPPKPTQASRKDIMHNITTVNGLVKQKINTYNPIENEGEFYLIDPTRDDIRQFKSLFTFDGEYQTFDEPDITHKYYSVELVFSGKDDFAGYTVIANFVNDPFEYERESISTNTPLAISWDKVASPILNRLPGAIEFILTNHTNAPMYPLLEVTANTGVEVFIQIGNQQLRFIDGLQGTVYIECKHRYQDVYDSAGKKYNDKVKGEFFEIMPGIHTVTLSDGVEIKIKERWCWL